MGPSDQVKISNLELASLCLATCYVFLLSIACLAYILTKLKLNKYIKAVLLAMTFINIVACSVMAIGQMILMQEPGSFNSTTKSNDTALQDFELALNFCRMQIYPWHFISSSWLQGSTISMLRAYLANAAAKTRIPKWYLAIPMVTLATLFNYLIPFGLSLSNEFISTSSGLKECVNNAEFEDEVSPSLKSHHMYFAYYVVVMGFGIFTDLWLYNFVKKRQEEPFQTQLVPWRSRNDYENVSIPIRATIISTVSLVICLTLSPIIYISLMSDKNFLWIVMISCVVTSGSIPLLILLLSIKQQNQIIVSQPPPGLQFHEFPRLNFLNFHDEDFNSSIRNVSVSTMERPSIDLHDLSQHGIICECFNHGVLVTECYGDNYCNSSQKASKKKSKNIKKDEKSQEADLVKSNQDHFKKRKCKTKDKIRCECLDKFKEHKKVKRIHHVDIL